MLHGVRLSGIVQIRKPAYAVNGSPFNSALRFLADYNYPEIPVVVDSGANQIAGWCENIGPVSLSERNSLSPGVGAKSVGTLGMESLTMANGASLIASLYQQEDGSVTSDLIRVKGNLTKGSNPIEIQFDRFPSGTNGVVKGRLLTAANLGTAGGLMVDDFTWRIQDASLNNIVTGELSIEQDADGTNYLFFTRTSTMPVYLTGLDTGGLTGSSFDRGTNWDNKKTPDAEHDYIVPNGQLLRCYVDAIPFKGRSLSVQEGGDFSICGVKAVVNDLRAYPGARFSTRTSNLLNQLQGGLSVYSTTAKPLDFMIEGGASARQLTLGASLVGGNDARVRFRCYTKGRRLVQTPSPAASSSSMATTQPTRARLRSIRKRFWRSSRTRRRSAGGPTPSPPTASSFPATEPSAATPRTRSPTRRGASPCRRRTTPPTTPKAAATSRSRPATR